MVFLQDFVFLCFFVDLIQVGDLVPTMQWATSTPLCGGLVVLLLGHVSGFDG